MAKTQNRFSPEVRERAVRMVFEHEKDYRSRWAAVESISTKIGCTAQTLNGWVKRHEIDHGLKAGTSRPSGNNSVQNRPTFGTSKEQAVCKAIERLTS